MCRNQESEARGQGLGARGWGSGFRVQGFRVRGRLGGIGRI